MRYIFHIAVPINAQAAPVQFHEQARMHAREELTKHAIPQDLKEYASHLSVVIHIFQQSKAFGWFYSRNANSTKELSVTIVEVLH